MGSNDRIPVITKILNGVVGVLLAVTGYFLISRDAEVTGGITRIWQEVASLRAVVSQERTDLERLLQEEQWVLEQNKDQENRLRELERRK